MKASCEEKTGNLELEHLVKLTVATVPLVSHFDICITLWCYYLPFVMFARYETKVCTSFKKIPIIVSNSYFM